MTTKTEWAVLATAHTALRAAVRGLDARQLALPTPCARWTVGQVVEHAVVDQEIWAAAVAGTPPPDGDAFAPTGDLPVDVAGLVDAALRRADAAWSSVAPDAVDLPSPLPQGPLDAPTAVRAAGLDAAVHAWDIAVAVGAGPVLGDELATDLTPVAYRLVEPLRQWGAYAAALVPQPGDSPAAALLRFLGRDPQWTADAR